MGSKPPADNSALRSLPSTDSLLRTETAKSLRATAGVEHLTALARKVTDDLRQELKDVNAEGSQHNHSREHLLREAETRLAKAFEGEASRGLRRVINATGVILHTNLGRAPLSEAARRMISEEAAGYCTLEYDLAKGERGRRGARAEDLLAQLTGAEAALIVNNCAAAALLVLTTLAHEGEAIVSRGELVEIGGDFRVPEVMAQSGTRMIEVGTTNRTRLSDYSEAISDQTRLVMRVHTSNYRIVGFAKTPALGELAKLAHDSGLLLFEDAGSGALIDFNEYGIEGEPVISESIKEGADVVSFSGDKLLGGPQTGLVVGRADAIEKMRSAPLYRVLRADKLRIAALEATLDSYVREKSAEEIPTHKSIAMSFAELETRATNLAARIRSGKISPNISLEIVEGESAVGGGSAPTSHLRTMLIALTHNKLTANEIESRLRQCRPPVIARIEDDRVLLDLRTVSSDEEHDLELAILSLT
jgi:L-seryl-tRNA(Ser) seleniumtransferase